MSNLSSRSPNSIAQALVHQSNRQKADANTLFASAQYSLAIGEYDKALSSCPNYLEYEIAVLKSNIAACHLKLEDWKAAIDSATAALDALDRLTPKKLHQQQKDEKAEHDVVEIEAEGIEVDRQLAALDLSDQRREDIRRIRAKALMRRARAKSEQGGWGNLQGAEEGKACIYRMAEDLLKSWCPDYRELAQMPNLPVQDKNIVHSALSSLPSRINAAKEREMGEMMGKLKEVSYFAVVP